jgi:biotin carboxyl carrier protein
VVRRTALSPAVGYFTPRGGLSTGLAVRSGDALGSVDVLGVPQSVLAPVDGVVGRVLVTSGEAVEYGQELVRIDGIERLVES